MFQSLPLAQFIIAVSAFLALAPLPMGAIQQSPPDGQTPAQERREFSQDEMEDAPGDGGESELIDEAGDAKVALDGYRSPYRLKFKHPIEELLPDRDTERGSPAVQSFIPEREWYSEAVRERYRGWGPKQRLFACPEEMRDKSVEWKRERIIAGASRFLGYDYQHHHIPDWNPPADWPWNKCCTGRQSKGVDCSTFSSWNYNWGLGIHMYTNIVTQSRQTTLRGEFGERHARVIRRPEGEDSYEELCRSLRAGDLLYIMDGKCTHVVHVIMWLGECGESPDGTPLVMDSGGGASRDCDGIRIPSGIHMRPFTKGSWFHKSFSHAHRWLE
ncbi:MAG: hypothetical protein FJ270_09815 [Planctomycetes bacterium]|nr:hypothetical protein [Planctomycetota bacterium]